VVQNVISPRPAADGDDTRRRCRVRPLVVLGVVLAILLILGLTSGGKDDTSDKAATTAQKDKKAKKKPARKRKKPAAKPKPTSVRLRVVPSAPTYVCVDRGLGTEVVYEDTTAGPQTFRGKHLRINIGNATTVRVVSNGKRVALPTTATIVGYDFTPRRAKPLPEGQPRPCAG
jgi:hypothetical protein